MEYLSSQQDGFDELKPSLFGTYDPVPATLLLYSS